ncbi:MAG: IMP dehydrogenase [Chthoniobacterales bacterium]|nr:IMP dehydrogenase [Chthoniobacterales bacterium]
MDSPTKEPLPQGIPPESIGLTADQFFTLQRDLGLTFDDITLATCYSEILPRQTRLESRLSASISLPLPILSADMDTVTEAEMAIAMALNGGMGIIHYNMSPRNQVKQVARVKNHVHGLISDPITVSPNQLVGEVLELIEKKNYSFRTFPVVHKDGKLAGLLPGAVVRERYASKKVADVMTPRSAVLTLHVSEISSDPIAAADRFFTENPGIHKILVVDEHDHLRGLFTLSDIERISHEAKASTRPARDNQFRLRCAAAIHIPRKPDGSLDKDAFLSHVSDLVREGLDAAAISTAHGHTRSVGEAVRLLRSEFPQLTIIAGNVTSAEGVDFLADAGADAIKVGQGPGSICTTRIVAGVGIPQMTALFTASRAKHRHRISIIADGGINKSGDIVKALTLADAVICGSLLAGCREAPGKIVEINGKLYKEYRGMGSLEAMRAGSAARYGHDQLDSFTKAAPEGIEALKELSGSVHDTLALLAGGIQSGLGYLGAPNLQALKRNARFLRVTPAGQREAAPHDVLQIKTTPKPS